MAEPAYARPSLEPGRFYLFACPWDWTFVGRFVRWADGGNTIIIDRGGYFTRTGATFDILSSKGFTKETRFHARADGAEQGIPAGGAWWPWTAPTPWAKAGCDD